jgi:NAD(P)-dependent dehydrogenase (short-subunit alcohol dehydrogenase family)
MSRLVGKVCVVNGAASEIGRAVAGRFAGEGAVVVGVDQAGHSVGEYAMQADLTALPLDGGITEAFTVPD